MKIGIIGTGKMGSTLGGLLAFKGRHEVFFGSRKRIKSESLAQVTAGGYGGIYEEACEYGEVVIMATPWHATEAIVMRLAPFLTGKILLDLTNPLTPQMDGIAVDGNTSGGEIVQSLLPETSVVKAFNGVPFRVLDTPQFGTAQLEVYMASDDTEAAEVVGSLASDLGFNPVLIGDLSHARFIEASVYLWLVQVAAGRIDAAKSIFNIMQNPDKHTPSG